MILHECLRPNLPDIFGRHTRHLVKLFLRTLDNVKAAVARLVTEKSFVVTRDDKDDVPQPSTRVTVIRKSARVIVRRNETFERVDFSFSGGGKFFDFDNPALRQCVNRVRVVQRIFQCDVPIFPVGVDALLAA